MNAKNDEIIEKHKLSGNALFTTSVFSTMKGEKKIPNGSSGGKDSYLSDTNEFLFKKGIDNRYLDRNYLNSAEKNLNHTRIRRESI
jgi:hypothetical protein